MKREETETREERERKRSLTKKQFSFIINFKRVENKYSVTE